MKVVQLDQRTDDWHAWRAAKGKFALADGGPRMTATMLNAIMNVSPYQNKHGLWMQMTNRIGPTKVNPAMQRGVVYEPEARACYNRMTGNSALDACIEHDEHSWAAASLDGLDALAGRLVEIKIPGKEDIMLVRDHKQVPEKYKPQVHWQLFCAGSEVEVNDFFVYDPDEKKGYMVTVPHDLAYEQRLYEEAKAFRQCIILGLMPFDDRTRAKAAIWLSYNRKLEEVTQALEAAKLDLIADLEASGESKLEVPGAMVTKVTTKGKEDPAGFLDELAKRLTEKTGVEVTPDQLRTQAKGYQDPFLQDVASTLEVPLDDIKTLQASIRKTETISYRVGETKDADEVLNRLKEFGNTSLSLEMLLDSIAVNSKEESKQVETIDLNF